MALQASSQGGSISKSRKLSPPSGCWWHARLRASHGQGGLQASALDLLIHISDFGELAGSWAFEQGSIAIIGARWVANILFFFFFFPRESFDSHLQLPDGNFANVGKMLFTVACISYTKGEWAKQMLSCYSVLKQIRWNWNPLSFCKQNLGSGRVKTSAIL